MRIRAELDGKPVFVDFDPRTRELSATSKSGFRYYLQTTVPPSGNGLCIEDHTLLWHDYRFRLADDDAIEAALRLVAAATGSVAPPKSAARNSPVDSAPADFACVGSNGTVRIIGQMVEITRSSLAADIVLGQLRGTKTIPVRTIQAVQLKRATATVGGAIEFVIAGDTANTGHMRMSTGSHLTDSIAGRRLARAGHENTVTFSRTQEPPFLRLHQIILEMMARLDGQATALPDAAETTADLVQQLERLQRLHASGGLDDSEFQAAKARLLES